MAKSATCEATRENRPFFSVGFKLLKSRPPTPDEKARGARRVISRWLILELSSVDSPAGTGTGVLEVQCD